MNRCRRKSKRRTVRTAAALTGLLLAWGTARAWGQGPELPALAQETAEQAPQVQRTYLNKGTVQLPIQIDERARARVREIQLFFKTEPSAPWQQYARATWGQNVFTFNAPRDGEYWFTMVTIDQQGRPNPPDVSKEGPGLIVIVDRQAPQVELSMLENSAEGQLLSCEVHDEYLDSPKTRLQYQTGDRIFRNLEPLPGKPNIYCIPAQAVFTGMLRVVAADLAGNLASRELHISQLQATTSAGPRVASATAPPRPLPFSMAPQEAPGEQGPITLPLPVDKQPAADKQPHKVALGPAPDGPAIPQEVSAPLPYSTRSTASGPELLRPAPQARDIVTQQRQLVNNAHVFLDYTIEQAGASGIGKVEVWLTRDQGQSWQRLCEDADKKSPAEIDLPGEGLFGVSLAISNGRGFGAFPPNPGETPQWWIEVDTTRPTLEISGVRTLGEANGTVQISWRASDKNLAVDGVELYYALSRQGPWQPIAKGLRSEASYRWTPPGDTGPQAYLRLSARDQAGNSAVTETTQPIQLDDQSRPRAQILGAATSAPR